MRAHTDTARSLVRFARLRWAWSMVALLAVLLPSFIAQAAEPARLVALFDADQFPPNVLPQNITPVGNQIFFIGHNSLWKSDGTAAGTVLVKDFSPNVPEASTLTNVNGTLFLSVYALDDQYNIWKSDGTVAGTVPVTQFSGYSIRRLISVDHTLFFVRYYFSYPFSDRDFTLWKTDGTVAGTALVKPLQVNSASSINGQLRFDSDVAVLQGTLFFADADGLWKTDGTAAGTVLLTTLVAADLTPAGNTLFFVAGSELWKTDGSAAGTLLVKHFESNDRFYTFTLQNDLTLVNGVLFFAANDGVHGHELWRSDGTEAGTTLIKDIAPGAQYSLDINLNRIAGLGNLVLFSANDGMHGNELWRSDGTEAGTTLIKDISQAYGGSAPDSLITLNNTLFFSASVIQGGRQLWRSDGTAQGTLPVAAFQSMACGAQACPYNAETLAQVNGALFFAANDGSGDGLWRSDGTAQGTFRLTRPLGPLVAWPPTQLRNVNGTLFFVASDGSGEGLWKTDGSMAGTRLVRAINDNPCPFTCSSRITGLTNVNSTLFFSVLYDTIDGPTAPRLWRSDGTAQGTVPIALNNLFPLTSMVARNGTLFVLGTLSLGSDVSVGLWSIDPNTTTITLIKALDRTATGVVPANLINVGGRLFFTADDPTSGNELWASDGTTAGTALVKDIYAGNCTLASGDATVCGSTPRDLTAVGATLYFTADDGVHGRELWKSDGTEAGTVLVKDSCTASYAQGSLPPVPCGAQAHDLTDVNGTLYFRIFDTSSEQLWMSDGTEAGTHSAASRFGLPAGALPQHLTALPGTSNVLFTAADDHGDELWISDGTPQGTRRVQDINPGSASANPDQLMVVENRVFFAANDGLHGIGLWELALAPTADAMQLWMRRNTTLKGVLSARGLFDPTLEYHLDQPPQHGKLTLTDVTKGSFTYTPNKNFTGVDQWSFHVTANGRSSNSATVTVQISKYGTFVPLVQR